jgi:hypothetical protein
MKLPIVDHDRWSPRRYHSVEGADIIWRQTSEGIEVLNEGVRRTKGEPTTLRRIVRDYGDEIADARELLGGRSGPPLQLIAAMIAAESKGMPTVENDEPHLKDISIGLTQTLTATAQNLAVQAPAELGLDAIAKLKPLPQGGDIDAWKQALGDPRNAIRLGALYFAIANKRHDAQYDPVICYAAYNAGSPRENPDTPWGLHYFRRVLDDGRVADAMENFVKWYGDACDVYAYCE